MHDGQHVDDGRRTVVDAVDDPAVAWLDPVEGRRVDQRQGARRVRIVAKLAQSGCDLTLDVFR